VVAISTFTRVRERTKVRLDAAKIKAVSDVQRARLY